jgi:hypothetical protein
VTSSGANYPSNTGTGAQNRAIIIDKSGLSDSVNGGLAITNPRFLASFDYAFNYNFLLGARVGYVALTYPGSTIAAFPPLHLEARATYVIGHEALASKGIAPVIFLAAGAAPFGAKVSVTVGECDNGNTPVGSGASGSCSTGVKPSSRDVNAWRVGGPVFVGPGGGLRWAFSDRAALSLNVKIVLAFGNGFLFDPTPELAMQIGF